MKEQKITPELFWKDTAKFFENMPSFYDSYTDFMGKILQGNLKIARDLYQAPMDAAFSSQKEATCCPPQKTCPPRCLAELHRQACPGERIVVPFTVRNKCGSPRDYQVGMRPLLDQHGNQAATQPTLSLSSLHLEPGQAITVMMTLDLAQGFHPGDIYSMDIVIREKDINQNICFILRIKACSEGVEVCPLDEREYTHHWHGWQDHFYCEQKPDNSYSRTKG